MIANRGGKCLCEGGRGKPAFGERIGSFEMNNESI